MLSRDKWSDEQGFFFLSVIMGKWAGCQAVTPRSRKVGLCEATRRQQRPGVIGPRTWSQPSRAKETPAKKGPEAPEMWLPTEHTGQPFQHKDSV